MYVSPCICISISGESKQDGWRDCKRERRNNQALERHRTWLVLAPRDGWPTDPPRYTFCHYIDSYNLQIYIYICRLLSWTLTKTTFVTCPILIFVYVSIADRQKGGKFFVLLQSNTTWTKTHGNYGLECVGTTQSARTVSGLDPIPDCRSMNNSNVTARWLNEENAHRGVLGVEKYTRVAQTSSLGSYYFRVTLYVA